jgi:transposase InsO family protein
MAWKEQTTMSLRLEFIGFARQEGANISELCRRFEISRKTAYKWLARYEASPTSGLADRSRRPLTSPTRTISLMEQEIVALRTQHPAWGGRKLRTVLIREGHQAVPAASTITDILRRHNLIAEQESMKHKAFIRFEHEAPNHLWQMDFKGHFAIEEGRCHPLTVIDDHSRYSLCLAACGDEQGETVKTKLTDVFRRYGLPDRMTMDNGTPWGDQGQGSRTAFEVWLMKLGIRVSHSRPFHPQTQGKDERFHRTLKAELLQYRRFRDLNDCQQAFDAFREIYNQKRPHEALEFAVPQDRYNPSQRPFPETLPPVEYPESDEKRTVDRDGYFRFRGATFKISQAFHGEIIALRRTLEEDVWDVYFAAHVPEQGLLLSPV